MVACILQSLALSLIVGSSALASCPARVVINANEIAAMISPVFEAGMRSGDPSILLQLNFVGGDCITGK